MLDRKKVLNWWTGRLSDQELADASGMPARAVAIVLGLPYFSSQVEGRGRGSRHSRRVKPQARNAVAVVQALTDTGMTYELGANVLAATPIIASTMTPVIDFSPVFGGVRSLVLVDPVGGWLPSDVVPAHVWDRQVLRCRRVDQTNAPVGDHFLLPADAFIPNTPIGTMRVDRSAAGLPDVEITPVTGVAEYAGEIDHAGFYEDDYRNAVAAPQIDDHLLIVNGRWVFMKSPDPEPLEYMQDLHVGMSQQADPNGPTEWDLDPVSVIEPDKKTVRTIGWGRDEEEQERARYYLKHYDSLLDVNMTLAVRRMKRRAYGLPVSRPEASK